MLKNSLSSFTTRVTKTSYVENQYLSFNKSVPFGHMRPRRVWSVIYLLVGIVKYSRGNYTSLKVSWLHKGTLSVIRFELNWILKWQLRSSVTSNALINSNDIYYLPETLYIGATTIVSQTVNKYYSDIHKTAPRCSEPQQTLNHRHNSRKRKPAPTVPIQQPFLPIIINGCTLSHCWIRDPRFVWGLKESLTTWWRSAEPRVQKCKSNKWRGGRFEKSIYNRNSDS